MSDKKIAMDLATETLFQTNVMTTIAMMISQSKASNQFAKDLRPLIC
jgi:hypothetical protein